MLSATPTSTMTVLYRSEYRVVRLAGKRPRTFEAYRTAVSAWTRFAPRTPINTIDTRLFSRFQGSVAERCGPSTSNCYCRHLMALLRYAASEDVRLIEKPPKWIKLREPKRPPLALTVEEFQKVLATAMARPGTIGGYPASAWWLALLLIAWETGLRVAALLTLKTCDVIWESDGIICQPDDQKDGEGMWFALPPHAIEAMQAIWSPDRKLLFPRDVAVETVGRWFREVLNASGIYAPKGCGMRFHRIRRSKASYTEAAGFDAQRALGHSSRSVTVRYLDPRIVGHSKTCFMPVVQVQF